MASYKIIVDGESRVPTAVPSYVTGELITDAFNKKGNGPTTRTATAATVNTEQSQAADVKMSVIDVLKNYDWKVSPNNSIVEHPYIILQEYRINKSPLLAQLAYNVKAAVENIGAGIQATTGVVEGVLKSLGEQGANLGKEIEGAIQEIEVRTGAMEDQKLLSSSILSPFAGLYYLKKTNFTYKLPYFSNKMTERNNSWQLGYPAGGSSDITDAVNAGNDFVAAHGAGVPLLGAFAEPGIYIERAKYFQPTVGQDPITVKFPLLNTLAPESIQKNYNLIWLLLFQNSSIRRNKTDVFPPCVYRVLIPGVRFILYASLEVTVEYVGTRRRLPVAHPATGETIDTIIPEAYNVGLTIESLTTECGNFLLKSLTDVL
jgi:hypothetical protein